MTSKTFTCESKQKRADIYLSEMLTGHTRSSLKKLFDGGDVTVNGVVAKSSQSLNVGDVLQVNIPDPVPYEATPQDIPIDIIYEDDDIAVINKQQGLTVHAGNGNLDGTLVNALLYNLKSLSGVGGVIRPGIVHRIDKNTSGLLVVAKNDNAHLNLAKQIEQKTCRRTYLALLEGNLKEDSGTVTTYIGRSPTDRVKMAVVPPEKGKIAITDFFVLQRNNGYTLAKFCLHTGRTHQIRVHAKYLGHPIVGDDVYGIKKQKFNLQGQLLHACKLELDHPATGERMTFYAPLPDYFKDVLNKLNIDIPAEFGGKVG
jgi:23S rRNA pseudouridine1911/1915/1917 synthase